ncbi:MAG: putative lipoprotein [Candidatus Saccharibacteria bacterium]|nr:putative lipoprotein [Candidatus Saccharibacteria bacterium]
MTIVRQTVAPLLLVFACAACGAGKDPLADSSVASASSVPATSNPPSPERTPTATPTPTPKTSASKRAQTTLPRGGREVFPRYRLVGYAGVTGASTLGRLGTGPLHQRVAEIERRAKPYAAGREILPVVEVIATIVQGSPGRDGKYRVRLSDAQIAKYHKAARKHRAVMLLNLQPGRSEFITEAKAFQKWLKEPDVGVALDPEWAMDHRQRPGGVYGHTTGAELDEVARYLSGLVKQYDLPEKVMVYHQVARSVVRKESGLKDHDGVVVIKSVDGLGHPGPKINTYRVVNKSTPTLVHAGFKLFFTEDRRHGGRLMNPKEVLGLKPRPEYVMFE